MTDEQIGKAGELIRRVRERFPTPPNSDRLTQAIGTFGAANLPHAKVASVLLDLPGSDGEPEGDQRVAVFAIADYPRDHEGGAYLLPVVQLAVARWITDEVPTATRGVLGFHRGLDDEGAPNGTLAAFECWPIPPGWRSE